MPDHWEGETSLGELGKVAEERGNIPKSRSKFLLSGGPSCASFGGGNMGLDGNDAEKLEGVYVGSLRQVVGMSAHKLGVDT